MSTHVLEPLGDKVLARQLEAKDRTDGGLILPDQSKQKPKEAIVLAVGPGKRIETGEIIPMNVSSGDHIIFASYAGQEVEVDGEILLLMSQDEILARLKGVS